MKRTVLISGANRGIGFGLVKFFAERDDQVIAACRNPDSAKELRDLQIQYPKNLFVETLDVASELSTKALASKCSRFAPLDILINNAAVMLDDGKGFDLLDFSTVIDTFKVNVIGPMNMSRSFLPLLTQSKFPIVANMSSKMGSIEDNTSGQSYGYRISKAALNMFNKSFSRDYPNITSVVLHPGWVKTDMGGSNAPVQISDSAAGLGRLILGLKKENSGGFFDFKGERLPW